MGFEDVWNSKDGNPIRWINEMTGNRGVDLAIEGAGVSSTLEQCFGCVRPFGRIVAMGNPAEEMKIA